MNLYFELLKKPVFSAKDIADRYKKISGARSAIKELVKNGLAVKIRKNLYTCISGETGSPVANRFQIASSITETSYVTHHSAMEYYGITDQVYHDVYVASVKPFREFDFDGYYYRYVHSKYLDGVEIPHMGGQVRVTDRERTLIDSINFMDKIGGVEEIAASISCFHRMRESYLLKYLAMYNSQFLYQKVGYLLWMNRDKLKISNDFFELCKQKIGRSTRYLSGDNKEGKYDRQWQLVIPNSIFVMKNGELNNDLF